MTQRLVAVLTLATISGCAGLASEATVSSELPSQAVQADMETLHRSESGFQVIDPSGLQIPLDDLNAGQQVRLMTSASNLDEMKNSDTLTTTQYIGTVESIDENNIVLKDVSLVTRAQVVRATPIVSRVPYLSRLFKNTSVGTESQPLPQGVTVPRKKVIMALSTETEFVEAIGVDFDFNLGFNKDTGESVLRDEAAFIVQERATK